MNGRERRVARAKRRTQLELVAKFMSTPDGREYLYNFLASVHIWSASFGEPHVMAFREGERNVGLRLLADVMEASPDLFLTMLKEHGNVRFNDEPTIDNGNTESDESDDRPGAVNYVE